MREPTWQTKDGSVRLYQGDAILRLQVLGADADVCIVDPVWPNCPVGLLEGADRPFDLFAEALRLLDVRTLVVIIGFDSDPRFLNAVPTRLPFIRSMQLPYAIPSYRGRLLGGDEMAYVFGEIPRGRGVIPGRCSTVTDYKADRATGHPCPRADQHLKDLVRWWSNEGDTIIDPFMGTGSTGIGAVSHGRRFVGCELDPGYFQIAVDRIQAELERFPLLEAKPEYVERTLFDGGS